MVLQFELSASTLVASARPQISTNLIRFPLDLQLYIARARDNYRDKVGKIEEKIRKHGATLII